MENRKILLIIIGFCLAFGTLNSVRESQTVNIKEKEESEGLRIAFGSCFKIFNMENDIFKAIMDKLPDLWVWLGDVAYTDYTEWSGCIII